MICSLFVFQAVVNLHQACVELHNSKKFLVVLEYVLSIGNILNSGTNRAAHGFKLTSLPKVYFDPFHSQPQHPIVSAHPLSVPSLEETSCLSDVSSFRARNPRNGLIIPKIRDKCLTVSSPKQTFVSYFRGFQMNAISRVFGLLSETCL